MKATGNRWRTLAARWVPSAELEQQAEKVVRNRLERIAPATVRPYNHWLGEDYYIFLLSQVEGSAPRRRPPTKATDPRLPRSYEANTRSWRRLRRRTLSRPHLSYYPRDLIVIGWNASLIYDTPSGAATSVQILEYVNSQLLEFRHYDELLTRELAAVYESLKHRAGLLKRWQMRREASRLTTVTVEVTELVERADTAIKFVSDMFSARLYRLAASKVGVPEYKNLVNEKLKTAEGLLPLPDRGISSEPRVCPGGDGCDHPAD